MGDVQYKETSVKKNCGRRDPATMRGRREEKEAGRNKVRICGRRNKNERKGKRRRPERQRAGRRAGEELRKKEGKKRGTRRGKEEGGMDRWRSGTPETCHSSHHHAICTRSLSPSLSLQVFFLLFVFLAL